VSSSARFASRRAFPALIASIVFGLGSAGVTTFGASAASGASTASVTSTASGTSAASTPTLEPGMNPFGLPRVVSFKFKPAVGATVTLGCTGTSAQPCTGTITASTVETLQGKKVVAVSTTRHAAIKLAQAPFSLVGGQTATIQLKLNSIGLKLLRRFHSISAYILAGEVIPQGKFVFLAHEVLFKTPVKRK
jgi:hypothetical protein